MVMFTRSHARRTVETWEERSGRKDDGDTLAEDGAVILRQHREVIIQTQQRERGSTNSRLADVIFEEDATASVARAHRTSSVQVRTSREVIVVVNADEPTGVSKRKLRKTEGTELRRIEGADGQRRKEGVVSKKRRQAKAKKQLMTLDTRGVSHSDWTPGLEATVRRHFAKVDLGPAFDEHGLPFFLSLNGLKHVDASCSYHYLLRAIIYQQLSDTAAGAIFTRFCESFGSAFAPSPQQVLTKTPEELRLLGLSLAKARSVLHLSEKYLDGTVQQESLETMSNDEIAECLIKVKGIGPWSVDNFLMMYLKRLDVLPVGDLGVRKGFKKFFGLKDLPDAEEMVRLSEPWRPYRSLGAWLMWKIMVTKP